MPGLYKKVSSLAVNWWTLEKGQRLVIDHFMGSGYCRLNSFVNKLSLYFLITCHFCMIQSRVKITIFLFLTMW